MDKSILLQKQVKDNTEDLQKEFLDMKNWEEQMKRKDEEIKKEAIGQITLPPVRSKHQNNAKNAPAKHNGIDIKSKRIKSYDYSAWDKFDVDKACTDVDKEEQSDDSGDETMSKEELEKVHQVATKHKNEGNAFVQQQKWSKAISCYNEAIKAFPYDAIFYANRALCQLKLDNFYSAESDCSTAIQLDETYVKAYHRRASARMNLKQYKEAKQDLEKVLKLEPYNKEAKSMLVQIENKIKVSEPSALNEGIKKLPEKLTIEKKMDKKICGSTVSESQATDSKNIKVNKCTSDDETSIKNIKHSTCNISTADKKGDTEDAIKKQERDSRIPDWLPEKDDVIVIEPTKKPPHLRSKKSLTRISVEEVEFGIPQHKYDKDKMECNKTESVLLEDVSKDNNLMESNDSAKISELTEDIYNIPPTPKTAVQFIMNWKTIKTSELRYKYLKQLSGNNLHQIFQDSMESNIFSEILEVLRTEFMKRKEPIFCYLKDLSQVKRFRALIMFISNSDKKNLKALFEYCNAVEHISQNELATLQNRYEL
ncbi:RNA polymerase II-associated protein spaghetti isoform X1 [Osmia lignaria lignaria]|uniref:RNA polymerase II-associated protein spaghetti isoform X1 n=1 Tax=Osmia lignaria lignaria TaxID=1437193 RepID=UPI00402BACF3